MNPSQKTLHKYHDDADFRDEEMDITVVFVLREPTERKRERIERAMEDAAQIRERTANRMKSTMENWGATKTSSLWYSWAKEFSEVIDPHSARENVNRVREAFVSWRSKGYGGDEPQFNTKNIVSFAHEKPIYSKENGTYYVSLPLQKGRGEREILPIKSGGYVEEYLDMILDEEVSTNMGELIYQNERYEFHQRIQKPVNVLEKPETVVGVDLGLNNIATAGAVQQGEKVGAELWDGSEAAEMRSRFKQRKEDFQKEERIEDVRDEEHRYMNHVSHNVSREIVERAKGYERPIIIFENLTDIREDFVRRKREYTSDMRRALHSWRFRDLQEMVRYKATEEGIPVEEVDPRNTSKLCNECGSNDTRREGVHFECNNCGYEVNADINGAFNIAARYNG